MTPVIALVGRPNVGKSTLFNCLTRTRDALVADWPGLTRDRKYGEGKLGEQPYIVVDTGGVSGYEEGLDSEMAEQSYAAIQEADFVIFLVDARDGVTASDHSLANHLRQAGKPMQLVVNKVDGLNEDTVLNDFYELGLGDPFPLAASHNRGVTSLITDVLDGFPDAEPVDTEALYGQGIRLAIVGRPNVGKSTLVNRMLGEERVVVYDHPGTTMDSIAIPFTRDEINYTLIDTAGIRRRKSVREAVEKFSIIKTLQAIQSANVVILVLDARDGVVEQDLHMLHHVLKSGRSVVMAVNKWDGMSEEQKDEVRRGLNRRLDFMGWADLHFISALHGTNVGHLFKSAQRAYEAATSQWSTHFLTELMQGIVQEHQPPMVNGRRIKLRYAHLGGRNPPVIVVHGNQVDKLPGSYKRYMENTFREVLELRGTPVRLEFRSGDNPYASTSNKRKQRR
ncbi:ribosome biogenesis GTPase Der [Natronospirillum operosum]|uniref:GTPase Der n=1 Tax=Natronospirillum operosum TaxID=2759953 RepID=A0A4Z0W9A7_9GAMM|nr:ribosome biogenesis GTPase Der [Natronospirillum operosum]TGG90382.1 ribosome biogenesis GTPase Der [Natronospirillum operosum]